MVQLSTTQDMYRFFGLDQPAFAPITAPERLFRSGLLGPVAKEVLGGAPVVSIRGGRGVGKTSFMHVLAMALEDSNLTPVMIDGAAASPSGVQTLLARAGDLANHEGEPEKLLRALWHESGIRRMVLLCDNADRMGADTFRFLALLLKLRVTQPIALQLVLLGEAGAWPGLDHPDLESLRLASSTSFTTLSLRPEEAAPYLDHRLRSAGQTLGGVMSPAAVSALREQAHGNPRLLDALAERALAHGYQTGRRRLTARSVRQALAGEAPRGSSARRLGAYAVLAVCLLGAGGTFAWFENGNVAAPVVLATAAIGHAAVLPRTLATPAPLLITHEAAVVAPIKVAAKPAQAGLMLIAGPKDTMPSLYARVYRGLTPPPYATVAAINQIPLKPGALVTFPEPANGWKTTP